MKSKPLQENPNAGNNSNALSEKPFSSTIGNQTETPSNMGSGTKPLNPNPAKNQFDNPHSDIPIPIWNLHNVLKENLISETIHLDNESNRVRNMIQNNDWLALKRYSR